ncbi:hypothetical protein [Erythrobacter donghaensis]|uniref:hypothetical protein n=1 Tax=Erythrobacter donghaensis TaxID=267135 RepID=UPI00093FCDB8|nr:hypothetical protein [Erythrobacter donghaensis]
MRNEIKAMMLVWATVSASVTHSQNVPATQVGTTGKIEPGMIIGSNSDQTINGWQGRGGGLYAKRTFERDVAVERNTCCYSVFEKDGTYTVAISVAVGRNATGGVLAEKIVATREIQTPVGYEETDCSLLWIDPALSFYNPKNDMAISYVIVDDEVREIRYVDLDDNCYEGD